MKNIKQILNFSYIYKKQMCLHIKKTNGERVYNTG